MPPVDQTVISQIAHVWKNIDPKLYEKFLRVLDAYTTEVTIAVTQATSTEILQAQGRAQQQLHLLRLFVETKPQP